MTIQEEGLDTVVIDFISYTENKINRFLVVEFIITLLLKGKEPLFQEVDFTLLEGMIFFPNVFLDAIQAIRSINTKF